ncbi:MAG: toxin-antitoxin system TumE family protein [Methylophilus sp.]|uniref:toxin-antitoxin system TumE family protein n=1 Tax=Methylophilus sp. TaxID=29541 RepID=UPI003F9EC29E
MKATKLLDQRIVLSESSFAELVVHQVPAPVKGSDHSYKYRLAYVFNGVCVMRLDNESGKGNHIHINNVEMPYDFVSYDQLIRDFLSKAMEMEKAR